MDRMTHRVLAVGALTVLGTSAWAAPARQWQGVGVTAVEEVRPGLDDSILPPELLDAGWTLESLARLATFSDIDTRGFDPVLNPTVQPMSNWPGVGVRPAHAAGSIIYPEPSMLKGFATLALWPRGEVLYNYSDDIIGIFLNPPDDPDADDLNALSVIPNSAFVFLYVNAVTQGRVTYLAYDEALHAGQGNVLIEVNGPLNTCFNVSTFGYQANPDGQLFNHCTWSDFASIVGQLGGVMGLLREHQRPDRDSYITVFEQNVGPPEINGGIGLFEFEKQFTGGSLVGTYDYGSIMHFQELQSSFNGLNTIRLKRGPALEWLFDNPDVVDNLVTLNPALDPLDPDFNDDLIDELEFSIGKGAGYSRGDINTLFELYGYPGDPVPWIFDPTSGCPADVNGDGKMTVADLTQFLGMLNSQSIFADLNRDGLWTNNDFQIFYAAWSPGFCAVPGKPKPPADRPVVGTGPG
ncbi:MAG: hypothetical protein DHS20C14_02030 [Phycisphaeraceae bacterium]|nr:MAG: hypothetical protein DHS20C14_02030 [Phycisphaeraceae bacterium]